MEYKWSTHQILKSVGGRRCVKEEWVLFSFFLVLSFSGFLFKKGFFSRDFSFRLFIFSGRFWRSFELLESSDGPLGTVWCRLLGREMRRKRWASVFLICKWQKEEEWISFLVPFQNSLGSTRVSRNTLTGSSKTNDKYRCNGYRIDFISPSNKPLERNISLHNLWIMHPNFS